MEFCAFNAQTQVSSQAPLPVDHGRFTFIIKTPPAVVSMIKKAIC
jgi:ribosomal protein L11